MEQMKTGYLIHEFCYNFSFKISVSFLLARGLFCWRISHFLRHTILQYPENRPKYLASRIPGYPLYPQIKHYTHFHFKFLILLQEEGRVSLWVHETKLNLKGEKIFSHTMCIHCHKVLLALLKVVDFEPTLPKIKIP